MDFLLGRLGWEEMRFFGLRLDTIKGVYSFVLIKYNTLLFRAN